MNKKLELLELNGQVYISFGYNDEDELLEIELDDGKGENNCGKSFR